MSFKCVLDFQVGLMYHNNNYFIFFSLMYHIFLFFVFLAVFVFRLSMPRRVFMT